MADHLLSIADVYKPAVQLCIDMLHRLGAHQAVAEVMLKRKMILQVNPILYILNLNHETHTLHPTLHTPHPTPHTLNPDA